MENSHIHLYIYTPTQTHNDQQNIMENRRSKSQQQMGRPKPDLRCKKHPKHQQSPGVCSICLRDKLSRLSTSTSSRSAIITMASSSCSSSSSLSSLSSHYSSSESSPIHHHASDAKRSISFLKSTVLTKSRSVAFVARMREGETKDGNKKGGFWSKLLRPRSKRMDESSMQSRTMRERVNTDYKGALIEVA